VARQEHTTSQFCSEWRAIYLSEKIKAFESELGFALSAAASADPPRTRARKSLAGTY
jgi:hypothetical protein